MNNPYGFAGRQVYSGYYQQCWDYFSKQLSKPEQYLHENCIERFNKLVL